MNEPIADAVRGILDGHIVLDRSIANRGHYPAVNVLASLSRCMKDVVTCEHKDAANKMRELLAAYADAEDLINLGAYAKGSNSVVDRAIEMKPEIDAFLRQDIYERDTFDNITHRLMSMFESKESKGESTQKDYVAPVPYFARTRRQA